MNMKRVFSAFLMILMMGTTSVVSAQVWVGGHIAINHTDESMDLSDHTYNTVTFAPTIGYDLNEKLALAASLVYSHGSQSTETKIGTMGVGTNSYTFEPFVRYSFAEMGQLRFFVDGGLIYGITHSNGIKGNMLKAGAFITPGVSYSLNERISLVAGFGGVNYSHSWHTKTDDSRNAFGLDFDSDLYLGFHIHL